MFTEKEKEIIDYVIEGMTNIEIAEEVGYSERSVKQYLTKIFNKIRVSNRTALTREALKLKSEGLL